MKIRKYTSLLFFHAGDIISRITDWHAMRVAERFGGWENTPDDYYDRWHWVDPFSWLCQNLMRISCDLDKNGDVWGRGISISLDDLGPDEFNY